MIIGTFFEGDDDAEIAHEQHEFYGQALDTIIETCNRLTQFAKAVLGDESHDAWGTVHACDHRTLQGAHDLLAAAWRFRYDQRQGQLPLGRKVSETLVSDTPGNRWLRWLRGEIESWVREPQLVRHVQLILANQNQPAGYASESRLNLAILDRYPDVPWKPDLRDACERDLAHGAVDFPEGLPANTTAYRGMDDAHSAKLCRSSDSLHDDGKARRS